MCNVCWKEFKGWCMSFTRVELCLSLLQTLLLTVFISCLTFLILHLLACHADTAKSPEIISTVAPQTDGLLASEIDQYKKIPSLQSKTQAEISSSLPDKLTKSSIIVTTVNSTESSPPDVDCTWLASKKTKATGHYYLTERVKLTESRYNADISSELLPTNRHNLDGEEAPMNYKNYVVALVKLEPPVKLIFGCILTKVSQYWTLTAGSCIESIEDVDSLDSFFIVESLGESKQAQNHVVTDVQIHPLYQGANYSYDLAALRSGDPLASSTGHLLRLPTTLDYLLVALGERFIILGYGRYRTIETDVLGRRLRRVAVHAVCAAQCGDRADTWALRHLARGGALTAGACGAARGLCAGALHARAAPCSYCAGTPLVREGLLYGVMSDNRQCGVACEPALYVNVAALRDWIHSVIL